MADPETQYATVTPYLVVEDADRELVFLKKAFDAAELACHRNDDGTVMHAEIKIGDTLIMLGQAGGQFAARPAAFYLWVPDVDATYARALAAGATSESEPANKPYGHRNAGVNDANGLTWWIAAPATT